MLQVHLRRPLVEWSALRDGREHLDTGTFITKVMSWMVTFNNWYPGFLERNWVIAQRPVSRAQLLRFLTVDGMTHISSEAS